MSGILDRVPSEIWLRQFITHQDSLIEAKDEYALKVMNWSIVKSDHNYNLTKHDLNTLMEYITQ